MGLLRQLLPVLGTIAMALGVSAATWNAWTNTILTVAGPIMVLASFIWSVLANSKYSIIQSASKMPEVSGITTNNLELAEAARSADPSTKVEMRP